MQSGIWTKYTIIKTLRDRIIHLKSIDRRITATEDKTIWRELLKQSRRNVALDAYDIIAYYLTKTKEKPRWFTEFPNKI